MVVRMAVFILKIVVYVNLLVQRYRTENLFTELEFRSFKYPKNYLQLMAPDESGLPFHHLPMSHFTCK